MRDIIYKKRLEELISTLLEMESKEQMRDFIKGILTPKELKEIPTRLAIVKMLKQKIAQRKIAEELKVGIATITRGSRELNKNSFRYI